MLLLNCDLGESFGSWQMGLDSQAMPYIDQANIACGFHAGDPDVIQRTLALAKQHNVSVGAHPAYPDLPGFGRRSLHCTEAEMINFLHYQIAALSGMAQCQGLTVSYVKPHGALYNDMMSKPAVWQAVVKAMARYHTPLPLMILATKDAGQYWQYATEHGVRLLFEAFADRRYTAEGKLTPRAEPGAVLKGAEVVAQVRGLVERGSVITNTGSELMLEADTLCVHGDNPEAIAQLHAIRQLLPR